MPETNLNEVTPQATINRPSISTTRFFFYVALGVVGLILTLFLIGGIITQIVWPPQDRLSHPVPHSENK